MKNKDCYFYSYDKNRKKCYLKEGKGRGKTADGWISGPKLC